MAVAPAAESAWSGQQDITPAESRVQVQDTEPCPCHGRFPRVSHQIHVTQHWGSHSPWLPTCQHICHHSCSQIQLCNPLSGYRQRVVTWVQMSGSPQPATKSSRITWLVAYWGEQQRKGNGRKEQSTLPKGF